MSNTCLSFISCTTHYKENIPGFQLLILLQLVPLLFIDMRLSSAIHLTRTALQPLHKNAWIKNTSLTKAPLYRHGWQPSTIRMTTTANIPSESSTDNVKPKRILYGGWIDKLPEKWAPYAFLARIDKPIGTWLLFWPCGKVIIVSPWICRIFIRVPNHSMECYYGSLQSSFTYMGYSRHDCCYGIWCCGYERCRMYNQ